MDVCRWISTLSLNFRGLVVEAVQSMLCSLKMKGTTTGYFIYSINLSESILLEKGMLETGTFCY